MILQFFDGQKNILGDLAEQAKVADVNVGEPDTRWYVLPATIAICILGI